MFIWWILVSLCPLTQIYTVSYVSIITSAINQTSPAWRVKSACMQINLKKERLIANLSNYIYDIMLKCKRALFTREFYNILQTNCLHNRIGYGFAWIVSLWNIIHIFLLFIAWHLIRYLIYVIQAGFIRSSKGDYFIEPSKHHSVAPDGHRHVLFQRSAVKQKVINQTDHIVYNSNNNDLRFVATTAK